MSKQVEQESVSYVARERSQIVVERSLSKSVEKLEMLRGFGFDCKHEFHAGFWLVHWKFPKLKLIASHVILVKGVK